MKYVRRFLCSIDFLVAMQYFYKNFGFSGQFFRLFDTSKNIFKDYFFYEYARTTRLSYTNVFLVLWLILLITSVFGLILENKKIGTIVIAGLYGLIYIATIILEYTYPFLQLLAFVSFVALLVIGLMMKKEDT